MRDELLSIIEKNSRIGLKELAVMLGKEEIDVANELAKLESEGVICGYHTLINWEKTSIEKVTALIEVRVTLQRGQGFDNIAERIYKYPEVRKTLPDQSHRYASLQKPAYPGPKKYHPKKSSFPPDRQACRSPCALKTQYRTGIPGSD